jgi:KipI family sensor histidine kinase inhibitor
MKVRPAGDRALLCDVADLDTAHRLRTAVVTAAYDGVVDVVPGWRTVLIVVDEPAHLAGVADRVRTLGLDASASNEPTTHVIPVHYDGLDLAEVAEHAGLSVDEVIRRHAAPTYTVAFIGFQPGFPYLAGLDPTLTTPRRESPRTSVPAGSVGIAGDVTGIYPRSSPGGWQLIGHTDVMLFDPDAALSALLAPGDPVRLEAVR